MAVSAAVRLLAIAVSLGLPTADHAGDSPPPAYGSGRAGRWQQATPSDLPSYRLRDDLQLPNSWSSGLQLGNDRYVALVGGDGSLSVRQDEGSPKLLTGGSSASGSAGGGLGYLQSSPTPFISGAQNLQVHNPAAVACDVWVASDRWLVVAGSARAGRSTSP